MKWRRRRPQTVLPHTRHGYQPPPEASATEWLCDDCHTSELAFDLRDWPPSCPHCGGRLGPHPGCLSQPWSDEAELFEAEAGVNDSPEGSAQRDEAQRRLLRTQQAIALRSGNYARAIEIERSMPEALELWNRSRVVSWLLRSQRFEEAVGEGLAALKKAPSESTDSHIFTLSLRTAEAALAIGDQRATVTAGETAVRCAAELGDPQRASREREVLERIRELLGHPRTVIREYNIKQLFAIVLSEVCETAPRANCKPTLQTSGPNNEPSPGPKGWLIYEYIAYDSVFEGDWPQIGLWVFPDFTWAWEIDGAISGRIPIDIERGDWFDFGVGYVEHERATALAALCQAAVGLLAAAGKTVPKRLDAIERLARNGNCELVPADQVDS